MDRLDKLRILVVEDEALIAMEIEELLRSLGFAVVGPVGHLGAALEFARSEPLDGGMLDVNISGGLVFPVAELLLGRGLPLIFSTGYGSDRLPPAFRASACLHKPFSREQLKQVVTGTFARCRAAEPRQRQVAGETAAPLG